LSLAFHVVIPARFAATRLPGKPLLDIGGRPMIQRVVEPHAQVAPTKCWWRPTISALPRPCPIHAGGELQSP